MTPAAPDTAVLLERIGALESENKLLRQKIDLLVRWIFGAKSEKLSPAQLELLLIGMENPPPGKSEASRSVRTGDTLEALPAEHPVGGQGPRPPRLPVASACGGGDRRS